MEVDRMLTVSRDLVEVFARRTGKHEKAFPLQFTKTLLGDGQYQRISPTYPTSYATCSIPCACSSILQEEDDSGVFGLPLHIQSTGMYV
jgi:hypothetical protein